MLVIVGANGRTGVELVRQALQRGLDVRAVVRDDRDADKLNDVIPVGQISYADPDHYESLPPALQGAKYVICCVDPRTGGPGAPIYDEASSTNVVNAASVPRSGGEDGMPVVNESVQMLLAMGFSLPRAVAAHAQFGEDLDSMIEYLTGDTQ